MRNKRQGRIGKSFLSLLLITALISSLLSGCQKKEESPRDKAEEAVKRAVEWKRQESDQMITETYLKGAGTSVNDWFVFAMARSGIADDYESYYQKLEQEVVRRYEEDGGLDRVKATEWHRIGLTMLALEKDPTDIAGIDLVADGTYNRGLTMELDAQGINGYIWALLLLDAKSYKVPEDAYETREEIRKQILLSQEENGAWGLMKGQENIDITAMALTALAPYKEEETVDEVIKKGLDFLSERQEADGGYQESGSKNSESVAQVLVALSSLGIDCNMEERFIKNENTVLDVLLSYQQQDGGFAHTMEDMSSNTIASEQACYALTAYLMHIDGKGRLYAFES